jgi:hypothetical protein
MMKNIPGLYLTQRGNVFDKFDRISFNQIIKSAEVLIEDESKTEIIEERLERRLELLDLPRQQTYFNALKELAKIDSRFEDMLRIALLCKEKKGCPYLSNCNIRKIKYALWKYLGNEVPLSDLDETRVKNELKKHGYFYIREKCVGGWYFYLTYIGRNWQEAFLHLESFLGINNRREDFV